jgi:hypothetical protein
MNLGEPGRERNYLHEMDGFGIYLGWFVNYRVLIDHLHHYKAKDLRWTMPGEVPVGSRQIDHHPIAIEIYATPSCTRSLKLRFCLSALLLAMPIHINSLYR